MTIPSLLVRETIDSLYEIANEISPKLWVAAYERMANLVNADGRGAITIYDRSRKQVVAMEGRVEDRFVNDYLTALQFASPLRTSFSKLKVGGRLNRREAITDAELLAHRGYEPIYKKADIFHLEYRVFLEDGPIHAGILFTRPEGKENFSADELAIIDELMPHLARTFRVRFRVRHLQKQNEIFASLFDRFPNGVFILDHERGVKYANAAAMEMVNAKDGLLLTSKNTLAADSSADEAVLRRAVEKLLDNDRAADTPADVNFAVERPSGLRSYELSICRMGNERDFPFMPEPLVSAFVSDFNYEPNKDGSLLVRMFDLTPSESRVAMDLAGGRSLNQIAESQSVSKHTVRTHLKRILSKTNTHSQGELIRLLLTGLIGLRPPDK